MRRAAAVLLGALVVLLLGAAPAGAHTVGGSGASDYRSRLLSFDAPAGITLQVEENNNKLVLTDRASTPVTVLGYSDEPYLLVTPSGVQENLRSTATYVNTELYATNVVVPPTADNKGVDYKQISSAPVAIWHDHRVHWNSTSLPPRVAADPGKAQVVQDWTVDFLIDGAKVSAHGELDWVPGPSPFPSVLIAVAALLLVGGLALRSLRFLGVGLVVLTAADVVHTVGVAADRAGSTVAGGFTAYPAVDVFWVLAVIGAALLLLGRRTRIALGLAAATGAWMLLIGGLADVATFHDSAAPFHFSIALERVLTAVELGAGIAVLAVAVRGLLATAGDRSLRVRHEDDDWDDWHDDEAPSAQPA